MIKVLLFVSSFWEKVCYLQIAYQYNRRSKKFELFRKRRNLEPNAASPKSCLYLTGKKFEDDQIKHLVWHYFVFVFLYIIFLYSNVRVEGPENLWDNIEILSRHVTDSCLEFEKFLKSDEEKIVTWLLLSWQFITGKQWENSTSRATSALQTARDTRPTQPGESRVWSDQN